MWAAPVVWQSTETAMYMSSPIVVGESLFGFSQRKKGYFFSLDPKSGKVRWASEGRAAENASVVAASGTLFSLTNNGELIVVRASEKGFEQVARYTLTDQPAWATPVIFGRQILVKDDANLTLWSW
jgi:outer membrane protein assembly factor BamB